MNKILILFLLLISVSFSNAQKRKKLPVVRAEVTVKGNFPPIRANPNEEDVGIWNEFVSDNYGFKISFPSKNRDISVDTIREVKLYETPTKKATYHLMVKNFLIAPNNNQIDDYLEDFFVRNINLPDTKLISKKDIYYDGRLGKEIIYEAKGTIIFSRLYILEQKFFRLMVSLPKKEYKKDFDKWAMKFFESFYVKTKSTDET